MVIPNLMIGFGIDEVQAEFIADIRLRNINKEYILKRTQETEELEKEIAKLEDVVRSKAKIRNIIIKELEQVIKKYPSERRTHIVTAEAVTEFDEEDHIEDYPVLLFMTREGYFKKITPQSWRMSQEHKCKEGDEVVWQAETTTRPRSSSSPTCSRRTRRACMTLTTARRPCWATIWRPSWAWTRARRRSMRCCGRLQGQYGHRVPERQGRALCARVL